MQVRRHLICRRHDAEQTDYEENRNAQGDFGQRTAHELFDGAGIGGKPRQEALPVDRGQKHHGPE